MISFPFSITQTLLLSMLKGLIFTGNLIQKRNFVKDNILQQQKPYGPYSEFDYLHAVKRTSASPLIWNTNCYIL